MNEQAGVFDAVGGAPFFDVLVERFYARIAADPLLRPLYPEDLSDSIAHMSLFLQQYWGGPGTYSEQRGHPRLRQRHVPFVITEAERDAWFGHMAAALDQTVTEHGVDPTIEARMIEHFAQTADFLVNAR